MQFSSREYGKRGEFMNKRLNQPGPLLTSIIHTLFILFTVLCILPVLLVISISLSSESDIINNGFRLIPSKISFDAFKVVFSNPMQILNSYLITILVAGLGIIFGLLINSMIAYALSRKDYPYRKQLSFFVIFTMLFNGGLVPWYLVISKLNLPNTIWVLILPYLANAWYIIILRTFFKTIPIAIIESAKIDGSNEFKTFIKIILPLSKPGLATVGLFILLMYWNDWWLAMLYIDQEKLIPLQYLLSRMMSNIEFLSKNMYMAPGTLDLSNFPNETARMAMCILAAGPMLFVFPFFQKYFVRGLTIGSIKG